MEEKIVVLDTNILIEAFERKRKAVQEKILEFYERDYELAITSITAVEFLVGSKNFGKAFELVNSFIILELDRKSWILASKIGNILVKRGETPSLPDLLIASICISNGFPLYTLNKRDFRRFEDFGLILVE